MARTTKSDVIIPELWDEAVQGAFAQKGAFIRSTLIASGAAVVMGDMPKGELEVGETIKVPYFGTIGKFEKIAVDGDPLTPKKLAQTQEQATVEHAGLAFEATRWSRSSAGKDIYEEGKDQMVEAGRRFMDEELVAKAYGTPLVKTYYSATTPITLGYDMTVDARMGLWGDEQDQIAAMVVDSKVYGDLLKMKDGNGRPLVTDSMRDDEIPRFVGMPLVISDHLVPEAAEVMGAVTEAGTTPPDVTLSGTPLGAFNILLDCVVGGARGTATFRFSTDGGLTWSATMLTAASVALTDTAVDSMVGVNGDTGLTAAFENATFNADNTWTASYAKHSTLLVKKGALALWYNRDALSLQSDRDILRDSDIGATHLYYAAHRYRRARGSTKSGVIRLVHN